MILLVSTISHRRIKSIDRSIKQICSEGSFTVSFEVFVEVVGRKEITYWKDCRLWKNLSIQQMKNSGAIA